MGGHCHAHSVGIAAPRPSSEVQLRSTLAVATKQTEDAADLKLFSASFVTNVLAGAVDDYADEDSREVEFDPCEHDEEEVEDADALQDDYEDVRSFMSHD